MLGKAIGMGLGRPSNPPGRRYQSQELRANVCIAIADIRRSAGSLSRIHQFGPTNQITDDNRAALLGAETEGFEYRTFLRNFDICYRLPTSVPTNPAAVRRSGCIARWAVYDAFAKPRLIAERDGYNCHLVMRILRSASRR
jgi:hypothetical protein